MLISGSYGTAGMYVYVYMYMYSVTYMHTASSMCLHTLDI